MCTVFQFTWCEQTITISCIIVDYCRNGNKLQKCNSDRSSMSLCLKISSDILSVARRYFWAYVVGLCTQSVRASVILVTVCYNTVANTFVFSFLRQLKTWHYPHLLLHVVLQPRAAATPTVQQVIDISYPPGPQQQTRHTLLQRANWTPYRFIDPDPHYYAGSGKKRIAMIYRKTTITAGGVYVGRKMTTAAILFHLSESATVNTNSGGYHTALTIVRTAILTDRCDCSRQQGFVF